MKKQSPSMDAWLQEAKAHPSAPKIGMYLTHNGIVRETAKAQVRNGEKNTLAVKGMGVWAAKRCRVRFEGSDGDVEAIYHRYFIQFLSTGG